MSTNRTRRAQKKIFPKRPPDLPARMFDWFFRGDHGETYEVSLLRLPTPADTVPTFYVKTCIRDEPTPAGPRQRHIATGDTQWGPDDAFDALLLALSNLESSSTNTDEAPAYAAKCVRAAQLDLRRRLEDPELRKRFQV